MRIVWLKTELLHPVDKGGRIRTYAMLRELRKRHHVTYITLDDGTAGTDAVSRADEYCHELIRIPISTPARYSAAFYGGVARSTLSSLPYTLARNRSADMRHAIERHLSTTDVDVLVCDFLHPAVNLPDRIATPTVLFQHNVEAMIWRRHYEVERNPIKRLLFFDQWRKMRHAEADFCRRFDCVIAVSADDRSNLASSYQLDRVRDVPTGVDTVYFQPASPEAADAHGIVFTGSLDWLPNLDAMRFFLEDITPVLRRKVPNFHFRIVGRNPAPDLATRVQHIPGVELTGRVPDVRPFIEQAAVYVVPIRIGSGTRLKIFEAMAMQRAVVSTTVGCEGLPVRHGEHLLIADTADDFANAIARLSADPQLRLRLATNAADLVRRDFSWARVTTRFEDILEETVATHRAPEAAAAR